MSDEVTAYVPCLRWKLGEYQAVMRLDPQVRESLVPLIEVPEVGYDFEKQKDMKSIDEHVELFAKRVAQKWGLAKCYVDARHIDPNARMANGLHPAAYIFDGLRSHGVHAVPVFGLAQDAQLKQELVAASQQDGHGGSLRVSLVQAAHRDFPAAVVAFLESSSMVAADCDFVLDVEAPNFDPVSGFAALVARLITQTPRLKEWRTLTLMGTAFPTTMGEVDRGLTYRERKESALHRIVCDILATQGVRAPRFGDYAIAHPQVLHMDMRLIAPAASVRYTTDAGWLIAKGRSVRRYPRDQYRALCQSIVDAPEFDGPGYSAGDAYILGCAAGSESTGSPTTWRWVGTNRHVTKVVRGLSS